MPSDAARAPQTEVAGRKAKRAGRMEAIGIVPVAPDTPLRLDIAANHAFPDGSMTAAGLRTEAKHGRLVTYRLAGKDYTTLQDIKDWVRACRRQGASGFGCDQLGQDTTPSGSSVTETARRAQAALLEKLRRPNRHSPPTSQPSTPLSETADVISLKSR